MTEPDSLSPLRLGASLYVPAIRSDLVAVANGLRYPFLKSVILCTEDSLREDQVEEALAHLAATLPQVRAEGPMVFIRPRRPEILARILALPGIERVAGFVIPKATRDSLADAAAQVPEPFLLMPTLETREVFDPAALVALRDWMQDSGLARRILALRIGGNDILNLLGIRRRRGRTLYDTAAGPVVTSLVTTFRPHGFFLSAPVFDDFGDLDTLHEEVLRDLEHGLVAKSAIHPAQVPVIEQHYRVSAQDMEMARRILDRDAPAVFQVDHIMCEPATHATWARTVLKRADLYGCDPAEADGQDGPPIRDPSSHPLLVS